jgi:hypothetical protein
MSQNVDRSSQPSKNGRESAEHSVITISPMIVLTRIVH